MFTANGTIYDHPMDLKVAKDSPLRTYRRGKFQDRTTIVTSSERLSSQLLSPGRETAKPTPRLPRVLPAEEVLSTEPSRDL